MYKILITGATGFIGGHLMKYLGSVGYEVESLSKKEFMNEDFIRLDNMYRTIFTNAETKPVMPDIVVHCAWPKLDLQVTDHLEFAEMTCNFYNECKKRGIRVINIGSSSEYGVKFEPMKEDMICEPINTYGIAKLMVTLYAKKLGFNTLRLFTVIGEKGRSFFDNMSTWDKWEYPKSVRTTVCIDKVCKAVERLMYAEHLFGEIINVGDDNERTYACGRYHKIGSEVVDVSDKWLKSPQRQYEPQHWSCDTRKMQKLLNI